MLSCVTTISPPSTISYTLLLKSKQAFRTFTSLLHILRQSKTDSPNIYKLSSLFAFVKSDFLNFSSFLYTLRKSKHSLNSFKYPTLFTYFNTDYPNFHKPLTRFVEVQPHTPIICKPNTCFAEVKMICPNVYKRIAEGNTDSLVFYKTHTCFVEVETDSPIFYKPRTRLVQTHSLILYKPNTRLASYTLCGSQFRPSEHVQASFTLCVCEK